MFRSTNLAIAWVALAAGCGRSPAADAPCEPRGRALLFSTSFEGAGDDIAYTGGMRSGSWKHTGTFGVLTSLETSSTLRLTRPVSVTGQRLAVGFFEMSSDCAGGSVRPLLSVDGGDTWLESPTPGIDPTSPHTGWTYVEATFDLPTAGSQALAMIEVLVNFAPTGFIALDDFAVYELDRCGVTDETPPYPPADMVYVPASSTIPHFYVDLYEATVDVLTGTGNGDQSAGPDGYDGSTTATALSRRDVMPLTWVSWYQAHAACRNAGKRLCTKVELNRACAGDLGFAYPYGDDQIPGACNDETGSGTIEATGTRAACMSPFGVYDLGGNLFEHTSEDAPQAGQAWYATGSVAQGGCAASGYGPKASSNGISGFRCCKTVDAAAP